MKDRERSARRRENKADLCSVNVDRGMVRKEVGCGLGFILSALGTCP